MAPRHGRRSAAGLPPRRNATSRGPCVAARASSSSRRIRDSRSLAREQLANGATMVELLELQDTLARYGLH
ncbi:hypothetical protein [Cupriavidus gilardii]|uniref:hypothetical protein n=1 Tax=Cupriavidus gilardii TaxID=82541 RepID=UPI001EE5A3FF|nr:hypothetical protein [Cupriavidus gilardii]MCG5258805.1 hypothetical protein [Cupriavidus gilardii]